MDVQNYCRWSVIGEGKVLWTFVHFPCWDTVYKKLWLELIVSPVLKNSSYSRCKGFLFCLRLGLYRFLPWNLVEMYNQIFEFIQIYCIMHLCWHSHTETSKNFFFSHFSFSAVISSKIAFSWLLGMLFPCEFSLTALSFINGECSYSCFIHSIILTAYYSL